MACSGVSVDSRCVLSHWWLDASTASVCRGFRPCSATKTAYSAACLNQAAAFDDRRSTIDRIVPHADVLSLKGARYRLKSNPPAADTAW